MMGWHKTISLFLFCEGRHAAHLLRDFCREEQQQQVVRRCRKAEVPVVPRCLLIERIDEQTNPACLGVDALRPCQGIDQQQFAQPLALILTIDSQPAQPYLGDATRPLLAPGFRQTPVVEFCQRQCVIVADAGWRFLANGDEGLRQRLVMMLSCDRPRQHL